MKERNLTNKLNGVAAAPGITIAKAYLYTKRVEEIDEGFIEDIEEALNNLESAIEKSRKELNKIFSLAVDKLGDKRAAIFEAQIMILDDPILLENIRLRISSEKRLPEYIVNDEISKYQTLMFSSSEPYLKERSQDIEDIKNRIIRNLKKRKWKSRIESDVIVVSENLTPADSVLFSRENVKGYVTDFGGLTSHTAIVARSLNIPAVVGAHDASSRINDGDLLIVDGFHGEVIINPTEEQLHDYRSKIKRISEYDHELEALRSQPAVTKDGREILLRANLDLMDEIEFIVKNGAKGIGLVRTEQIFQDSDVFPDEEEQYKVYSQLAEKMYPETVVIRVFDIGGDKVLPVDVKEPNPFLGWRGIRFLLDNLDLFKTQVRAILRASIHKNIYVLIPMISSIREIHRCKSILKDCMDELRKEGISFDEHLKLGIMIEVPSAAVMAKEFASEVDFISIGTNDLIQYLLAVDRGNEIVSSDYEEFHPAVIKSLYHIIHNGKQGDVKVSMCGEMAGDILAVPLLLGMGLDSLSVSPAVIPSLKKIIRSLTFVEAQRVAQKCLELNTVAEIKSVLEGFLQENFKEESENIF